MEQRSRAGIQTGRGAGRDARAQGGAAVGGAGCGEHLVRAIRARVGAAPSPWALGPRRSGRSMKISVDRSAKVAVDDPTQPRPRGILAHRSLSRWACKSAIQTTHTKDRGEGIAGRAIGDRGARCTGSAANAGVAWCGALLGSRFAIFVREDPTRHAATHHTRSRHARRVRRPCCTRHDSCHRPRRHRRTRSAPSCAGRRPCRAAKAGHSRATLGVQRQRCRRAAHRRRLGREVRRHGCKGCHLRTGETEGGRQGTLEGRVLRAVSPTACGRSSGNTPPARSRARAPLSCHMHTAPSRVVIQRSGARIETSTRSRARARSA